MNRTALTVADYYTVKPYLPRAMQELISLIGVKASFILLNAYAGRLLPISKNRLAQGKANFAALSKLIGVDAAEKLTIAYSAQRKLHIPKCQSALAHIRNQRIIALFDELTGRQQSPLTASAAIDWIVQEYGINNRYVWRIVNGK